LPKGRRRCRSCFRINAAIKPKQTRLFREIKFDGYPKADAVVAGLGRRPEEEEEIEQRMSFTGRHA